MTNVSYLICLSMRTVLHLDKDVAQPFRIGFYLQNEGFCDSIYTLFIKSVPGSRKYKHVTKKLFSACIFYRFFGVFLEDTVCYWTQCSYFPLLGYF